MNRRFPVLSVISVLMRIIGWLYMLAGLVYWVALIVHLLSAEKGTRTPDALVYAGIAAFLTVFGLLQVFWGESIQVLFAIEDNTHAAAEHLFKIVNEKSPPKDLTNR